MFACTVLWFFGFILIFSGGSTGAAIGVCLMIAGAIAFWRKSNTRRYPQNYKRRD